MNNKISLTINILLSIHFIFLIINEFQFVAILFQCCQTMLLPPLLKAHSPTNFIKRRICNVELSPFLLLYMMSEITYSKTITDNDSNIKIIHPLYIFNAIIIYLYKQ